MSRKKTTTNTTPQPPPRPLLPAEITIEDRLDYIGMKLTGLNEEYLKGMMQHLANLSYQQVTIESKINRLERNIIRIMKHFDIPYHHRKPLIGSSSSDDSYDETVFDIPAEPETEPEHITTNTNQRNHNH
jgi:hypothetical protein